MIFFWLFAFVGLGVYGWTVRKRWMVVAFGSLPGTFLTYYLFGIGIARAIGQGRFYSVPFGGFLVGGSDAALFGSIAFWWVVWIGILFGITRSFSSRSI